MTDGYDKTTYGLKLSKKQVEVSGYVLKNLIIFSDENKIEIVHEIETKMGETSTEISKIINELGSVRSGEIGVRVSFYQVCD